jgi:hypothetical protein
MAEDRITGWKKLIDYETKFESFTEEWVFRGQSFPSQRLRPTLERAFDDFEVRPEERCVLEDALIRDFKRLSPSYAPPVPLPSEDDTIAWVALMRHYGAPTRFLDFTFSFFVATYFAVQAENSKPVVWAINKTWLTKQYREAVLKVFPKDADSKLEAWGKRDGAVFRELFQTPKPIVSCIWPVGPYSFNDRLAAQQGHFLCANYIATPFHDTLESLPGSKNNVKKVLIDSKARREILIKLHRTLTSSVTIFPGFQGFAESMRLKIPVIQMLEEMKRQGGRLGPNITDGKASGT